jgi:hypothetical protein
MRTVVVGVCAVALAWAAAASAVIVPQRSIAGVRLGMTKAQLRATLGAPKRATHGTNEFGAFTVFRYRGLSVTFQGNQTATNLLTSRPTERTVRDVGVGSTEAEVRAKVAGVRCRTEGTFRHCFVGRFLPGRRITDFRIRHGRVSGVDIGFVID